MRHQSGVAKKADGHESGAYKKELGWMQNIQIIFFNFFFSVKFYFILTTLTHSAPAGIRM